MISALLKARGEGLCRKEEGKTDEGLLAVDGCWETTEKFSPAERVDIDRFEGQKGAGEEGKREENALKGKEVKRIRD